MACLEVLVSSREPVGSREVARKLGMLHTTVNRLLGTLASLNLAERTTDRKYQPGPAVHVLAALSLRGSMLLPAALPHLRAFREENLTAALAVLWRDHVCYLVHAKPPLTVDEGVGQHKLLAVRHSSLGVALASQAYASSKTAKGAGLRIQKAPVVDLERHGPVVARQGVAILNYHDGEYSVGVPIGTPGYAAIGASGTYDRDQAFDLARRLREAARHIHEDMNRSASPGH